MTQLPSRGLMRMFRLTNEPDGLGLSCTPAGLSLAGVPLLRRTQTGFVPRPAYEVASLLKAAYGEDSTRLQSRLGVIAQALNRGDFAAAMITAVHTRTPELSRESAMRLVNAEQKIKKYNYSPDEPRDWHGRWTRDGAASQASPVGSGITSDQVAGKQIFDQQQLDPEDASPTNVAAATGDIMRSIVKNACIAECSESSLPTYNYGWKFFNCINDCMRRHGYDPFAVRP